WLNCAFATPSQYNKGRAMLHAFFEFALRREWCDKNPIKQILRKKVIEKEILPLKLSEIRRIIANAKKENNGIYLPAVALLVFAGIRPREVRKLTWQDIDLQENTITIRSQCSKTGGVRQVEIMPQLKRILLSYTAQTQQKICPANWQRRWRKIRNHSGFSGRWVQDVLRHTYASFFAKRFKDLPRLQLNMGHSNQMLLCHRYINMRNISRFEAEKFFN
ncbi:MAG: tyrosine-type recombinase/integrase, partial [Opitutales bacterium]|nr:tyrosine-type recombinase/integrase [Opitutales bacterium]